MYKKLWLYAIMNEKGVKSMIQLFKKEKSKNKNLKICNLNSYFEGKVKILIYSY